ncbi:MAG: hypothetical protein JWO60_1398 [Frankiales bacterium]|nr:hypothetical protein [Frankiales bacterium]
MTSPYIANEQDHQRLEWLGGEALTVLLDAASTGGQLMVLSSKPKAGTAAPLHVHGSEDEMFLLLSGSALVFVGNERFEVEAGGSAFLPRDVPHAYRITADAHVLTLATPAGLEGFFRQAGHDLSTPKPDDWTISPATMGPALAAHGGRIIGPPPA